LAEVTAYTTETYGVAYSTAFFVVMNKTKWNGLPKDIQEIIEKINGEWAERQGRLWDDIDREGKTAALQKGMKYIKLSPEENARWAAAVRPILDDYVKMAKDKELPGDQALQSCLDFLKSQDK